MPRFYLQYGATETHRKEYATGLAMVLVERTFLDAHVHTYKKVPNEVLSEYDANNWLDARTQVPFESAFYM